VIIDTTANVIIDTPRNRTAYENLVKLVGSGRALAFVGAGVTIPLGYPTWDSLVTRLAQEVRAVQGDEIQVNDLAMRVEDALRYVNDNPALAQILKHILGETYFRVILEVFGPKDQVIAPITCLVNLPLAKRLKACLQPTLGVNFRVADHPGPIAWWHTLAQLRRDMAVFFLCARGSDPLHLNREREP
jgi:hypothetical protein